MTGWGTMKVNVYMCAIVSFVMAPVAPSADPTGFRPDRMWLGPAVPESRHSAISRSRRRVAVSPFLLFKLRATGAGPVSYGHPIQGSAVPAPAGILAGRSDVDAQASLGAPEACPFRGLHPERQVLPVRRSPLDFFLPASRPRWKTVRNSTDPPFPRVVPRPSAAASIGQSGPPSVAATSYRSLPIGP